MGNRNSKKISQQHKDLPIQDRKIFICGTAGSGKSAIFRQTKFIYGGGYNNEERQKLIAQIHFDIISEIHRALQLIDQLHEEIVDDYFDTFLEKSKGLSIELSAPTIPLQEQVKKINITQLYDWTMPENIAIACKCIWKEPAIQTLYTYPTLLELNPYIGYFIDNIDRITSIEYIPTNEDILRYYRDTITIEMMSFNTNSGFKMDIKTSSQGWSHRTKYRQMFVSADILIYVVSISNYDERVYGQPFINCMDEQLSRFDQVCNKMGLDIPIILVFNKTDCFKNKIETVPIITCNSFKDDFFGDEKSYFEVIEYIKAKFLSLNTSNMTIIEHTMCAWDKEDVKELINIVSSLLEKPELAQSMSMSQLSQRERIGTGSILLFSPKMGHKNQDTGLSIPIDSVGHGRRRAVCSQQLQQFVQEKKEQNNNMDQYNAIDISTLIDKHLSSDLYNIRYVHLFKLFFSCRSTTETLKITTISMLIYNDHKKCLIQI